MPLTENCIPETDKRGLNSGLNGLAGSPAEPGNLKGMILRVRRN